MIVAVLLLLWAYTLIATWALVLRVEKLEEFERRHRK